MSINDEFTPPTIIDYDYYVSNYVLPVTDNTDGQKELIDRWIIQCQDQIDVLCGGRVYQEYDTLDLTTDEGKLRQYYLRKAICSLLEYYIDTGKAFVDKNFSSASNVPANINASSEDANFEHKRKDIIKLLTQGKWYQTFNTYTNALDTGTCSPLAYDFDYSELVEKLSETFKRLDNNNSFNTNQVLNNYNLTHIGSLAGYNAKTSYLRNFILDTSIDLSKVLSVSKTGKSSVKVNFITINGVEYYLGGGGSVTDVKQNGESVLDSETGIADIDAYKKEDAQQKVYYGSTEPEEPKDNDIWVDESLGEGTTQKQSDWEQTDDTQVDFIKNKPTIPAAQIQSDWNQTDSTKLDYIKNKPDIPTPTEQHLYLHKLLITHRDDSGNVIFTAYLSIYSPEETITKDKLFTLVKDFNYPCFGQIGGSGKFTGFIFDVMSSDYDNTFTFQGWNTSTMAAGDTYEVPKDSLSFTTKTVQIF